MEKCRSAARRGNETYDGRHGSVTEVLTASVGCEAQPGD
jgi:hypothetical protein